MGADKPQAWREEKGPQHHRIELPMRILIGNNVLQKVPEVVGELKASGKVALVVGRHTYEAAGRTVEEMLKSSGYEVGVLFVESAHVSEAEAVAQHVAKGDYDVIVSVGGGKAIDVGKYAAGQTRRPFVSVPTAPSHDGITSPFASIKGLGRPVSVRAATPAAIVADVEVIRRAPRRLILAGLGDLLGKLVAVKDWQLAHRLKGEYYGEYAAQLALLSARHVMRYHEAIAKATEEGVRVLVEALVSSGVAMCIAGSSRPASGSEHLFSHALDIVAPGRALHGEQVALGTIVMLYIWGDRRWAMVRRLMERVGLPTKASQIGIEPEKLVEALTIAHKIRPERYTILGENGISREAAWKVLRETGIID
ncbi:MAG: NAD(P)-dependent glycerol-1-phosphate dehydrogenase [Desulfurococcaceae archaeon]